MAVAHEDGVGDHLRRREHYFESLGCGPVGRRAPAVEKSTASGDDPPPLLQPHYRAFVATTKRSAPLR
jgi:hypothetical protein